MILKLLRNAAGGLIVLVDRLTRPSKLERSPELQQEVESELRQMTLYQLYACPFCIKTRRALHRLNLPMEIRSVSTGSPYRQELELGGGRIQAPCLRLQQEGGDVWMYESGDIISYLEQRFGVSKH